MLLRAFRPYLVTADRAQAVVSPAYDSMGSVERVAFARDHPDNYINTMRAPDDFPPGQSPTSAQLLQHNVDRLQALLSDSSFVPIATDALFVYRLSVAGHQQTGVVGEVPVAEYQDGNIKKHEGTRGEHEKHLCRYLDVVGASSSPISLAYRDPGGIEDRVSALTHLDPELDFVLPDGVRQQLWQVTDPEHIAALVVAFQSVPAAYLADGHHRSAAAVHHAASRRRDRGGASGPWDYLVVALFPATQLRVLSFNRCVKDLGGLTPADFLQRLAVDFTVEPVTEAAAASMPGERGQFLMLLDGQTYSLTLAAPATTVDPVAGLDVSVLQDRVLQPLLGISDARNDPRLDYVPGGSGLDGLRKRCDDGWQVGFVCFPTSLDELMMVSDAGQVMPPKSTCFEPKPCSGLFLRLS